MFTTRAKTKRVLIWCVATLNISSQLKTKSCAVLAEESLEQRSKLPEVMQMVHGRAEKLCAVLNHEIISACIFGH